MSLVWFAVSMLGIAVMCLLAIAEGFILRRVMRYRLALKSAAWQMACLCAGQMIMFMTALAMPGGVQSGFSVSNICVTVVIPLLLLCLAFGRAWLFISGANRRIRRGEDAKEGVGLWRRPIVVGGHVLGYRSVYTAGPVTAVWHTSLDVRTHVDFVVAGETDCRFLRLYINGDVSAAARSASEADEEGSCLLTVGVKESAAYLQVLLGLVPEVCADIVRAAGAKTWPCSVIVPSGSSGVPLPLSMPGVFPCMRVKPSPYPASPFEGTTRSVTLEYRPRIAELAAALRDICSDEDILVCPQEEIGGAPRLGSPDVQTARICSADDVAGTVLASMTPVPFLGFIVSESPAQGSFGLGMEWIAVNPQAVSAVVAGVYDGESFAVYIREELCSS